MILFEFTICDRQNIPEQKLVSIAYEELAVEARKQKWTPGYRLVQACFPIRQPDGSLLYTFLVTAANSRSSSEP